MNPNLWNGSDHTRRPPSEEEEGRRRGAGAERRGGGGGGGEDRTRSVSWSRTAAEAPPPPPPPPSSAFEPSSFETEETVGTDHTAESHEEAEEEDDDHRAASESLPKWRRGWPAVSPPPPTTTSATTGPSSPWSNAATPPPLPAVPAMTSPPTHETSLGGKSRDVSTGSAKSYGSALSSGGGGYGAIGTSAFAGSGTGAGKQPRARSFGVGRIRVSFGDDFVPPPVPPGGADSRRRTWTPSAFLGRGTSFGTEGGGESVVFAPDDAPVPPQTPLWGSSKIVANVKHQDIRRRESLGMSLRSMGVEGGALGDSLGSGAGGAEDDDSAAFLLDGVQAWRTRTNFYEDAITFAEGSIPQSILVALAYGVACGLIAFVYYEVFFALLDFIWKTLPQKVVVGVWPEHLHVLWIPLMNFSLSILSGLSITLLGEPGDLAFTVKCVHEKAYESTSHIIPMFFSSLFSLLGGASCGPEAPLVSICASTSGYMSRKAFRQRNRNVVRKHTLMGMAGALAAFFGAPLGGSLFALEVNSRFGVEYFEHAIESIFCGVVCLAVFRSLCGLKIGAIWDLGKKMEETGTLDVLLGALIGLLGAALAALFATFHWRLMGLFHRLGLVDDENRRAVPRALLGAAVLSTLGMLIPHTMFWGEFEFESVANMVPSGDLPHVWPPSGLIGFEINSWGTALTVGFAKLLAISFTIAAGYRGGYIFPFFTAGAAFGRAFSYLLPQTPPQLCVLCFAAGINVAITRTPLATPLILSFLAGEQFALPAILASSVVSLFATGYMSFIKSQIIRSDLDHSLYYKRGNDVPLISETIRSFDVEATLRGSGADGGVAVEVAV